MKKRFTLFLMMLFSFAAYQILAQSEYQQARFNTAEEINFIKFLEMYKKLWPLKN